MDSRNTKRRIAMAKRREVKLSQKISTQPHLHQRAAEIQAYGTVNHLLPLELEEPVTIGSDCAAQSTPSRHHDAATYTRNRTGRSLVRRFTNCISSSISTTTSRSS